MVVRGQVTRISASDWFLPPQMNEYDYEEELEQSYRSSMFKAFQRTLNDGWHKFIVIGMSDQ